MGIIHGRNIIIYQGSSGSTKAIAGAKSCNVSKKADTFEKSSSTSATAKEFISGRTEWEISMGHLITDGAPFEGILKVGGTYHLRVTIGNTTMQGDAICTQATLDGSVGNLANGSIKFKGTGELA